MNPNQNQSIDTRERIRRSFDKIRVNNPFDIGYATIWDGFHHVVPAKSFAILDRFLAEKWLEEQAKRIITEKADAAVKTENKRRIDNGMAVMDKTRKTGEQYEFETPFYANWTASFTEVIKEYGLYGGIAQEYGLEYIPQAPATNNQIASSLIDELEKAPQQVKMAPTPTMKVASLVDELEKKDIFTLHKIAREKGLTTEKTDKKEDLIRRISQ